VLLRKSGGGGARARPAPNSKPIPRLHLKKSSANLINMNDDCIFFVSSSFCVRFAGTPVEVGITMYVLSISSLSEVKMVQRDDFFALQIFALLTIFEDFFVCVFVSLTPPWF
jgi:hypothetical protein